MQICFIFQKKEFNLSNKLLRISQEIELKVGLRGEFLPTKQNILEKQKASLFPELFSFPVFNISRSAIASDVTRSQIDGILLNPLTTAHFVTHRSYHTAEIVLRVLVLHVHREFLDRDAFL